MPKCIECLVHGGCITQGFSGLGCTRNRALDSRALYSSPNKKIKLFHTNPQMVTANNPRTFFDTFTFLLDYKLVQFSIKVEEWKPGTVRFHVSIVAVLQTHYSGRTRRTNLRFTCRRLDCKFLGPCIFLAFGYCHFVRWHFFFLASGTSNRSANIFV